MSSFLDRLKKKNVIPSNTDDAKKTQIAAQNTPAVSTSSAPAAEQLKVDIFQTPGAIIIYAQLAGSSINDYSVTIEGDDDIVTIKGQRTRPNGEHFQQNQAEETKEKILEECLWGRFYRQIILPAAVDAAKTEAKMKEGVLMLRLPLREHTEKGVRISVVEV